MKIQVTVCLCFSILSLYSPVLGNSEYLQNPSKIQENTKIEQFKELNDEHILSECFDLVVQNISNYIKKVKLDSVSVPDNIEEIKHVGEIGLKNGILSGFSTVFRRESIITSYSNGTISIHAPLEFKTMSLRYDYVVPWLWSERTGPVTGEIEGLQVILDLYISLRPIAIKLSKFQIVDSGIITVKFGGSDWWDEIATILTTPLANILSRIILRTIENLADQPLKNQIDLINKQIVNIFSP